MVGNFSSIVSIGERTRAFQAALKRAVLDVVSKTLTTLAIAGMIVGSTPGVAFAISANTTPQGGQVVAGSASFDYKTGSLTVNQQSQRTVIDWNSFNIGENASTEFKQPGTSSLAVNRVTGGSADPTQILGTLKSNGQVMVLDPSGVLFGANARIDVGGIIASTGSIDVNQVMSGSNKIDITQIGSGSVVNQGLITVKDGGLAAFVAPHVVNSGIIIANLGRAELASGSAVTVDLYGDKLVELAVNGPVANALVENSGTIIADGGRVALTAKAAQGIVNNVINTTGIIRAASIGHENGRIVLRGNDAGTVRVSGAVIAQGANGNEKGGRVDITGNRVSLENALIDVSGKRGGGEVYVGGGLYGSLDGMGSGAAVTDVSAGTVIHADARLKGNGGTVVVWGNDHTGYYGTITARGGSERGNGGLVEVSTGQGVIFDGSVDTTAARGQVGTLLIDPAMVSIWNGAATADGSYINAQSIANNLVFTSVSIQATDSITIADAINLASSSRGTPAFDLTLTASTFNLDHNMNTAALGNLFLNSATVNMSGKITSGTSLIDPSRVFSTATQMNVLANTASIQQAMDISSRTAPVTVQVAAGSYNENLVINKSLTLSGGANAPVIQGTVAGGNIITVNADNVAIEGLHLTAQVGDGSVADSVNGVAAGNVSNLTLSHNTLEGFAASGLSVPATTTLDANLNILSPAQQAAADAAAALAAQQAADAAAALAAQQAADAAAALAAQQAADAAAALAAQQAADAAAALAAQQAADAAAALAAQQAAAAAAALAAQQAAEEAAAARWAAALAAAAAYLPAQASAQAMTKVATHILEGMPLPHAGRTNPGKGHHETQGQNDQHGGKGKSKARGHNRGW